MKAGTRQFGATLMEMTVVVTAVSLLMVFGMPAVRTLYNSMESRGGTRAMISAALASARAIAAKEQRYAGIRFQEDLNGHQYVIFIVQDPEILAYGFRAVEGLTPIRLPDSVGVMDLMVRTNHGTSVFDAEDPDDEQLTVGYLDDTASANLDMYGRNKYITDTTSFSVVFSPAGRLVMHYIRVRNRDGICQPDNSAGSSSNKFCLDDVFNSPVNIRDYEVGMFEQDDYAHLGLGQEWSRNSFVIYDKRKFDEMNANRRHYYLFDELQPVYINPYTGTMIK